MWDAIKSVMEALDSYGPVAVVLIGLGLMNGFFIWRDYQREANLRVQIDELNRIHNEIVLPLLTECKEAIATCKEAIQQNSAIIQGFFHNGR